jgi:hypothetical protein
MTTDETIAAGDAVWARWRNVPLPLGSQDQVALVRAVYDRDPSIGHVVAHLAQRGELPDELVQAALATTCGTDEMVWMRRHVRARETLARAPLDSQELGGLLQKGLSWAVLELVQVADAQTRQRVRERLMQDNPFTKRQRARLLEELGLDVGAGRRGQAKPESA